MIYQQPAPAFPKSPIGGVSFQAETDNRKNFPLHNSQPLLPAETSPTLEERSSLPPTKEKSAEDEQRRLAAMAASLSYEHAKFEKKGMISFGCPLCNRPLWVDKRASGLKLKCVPFLPTPQGNLSSLFHRIDGVCRGL